MGRIRVQAEEGVLDFGFDDLVRYHGHAALAMLAITFQAQALAFAQLSPDRPPRRSDISVVSGHAGPGVRDAFEAITRCVTRGSYTLDFQLPGPRLNPASSNVYAFRVVLAERGARHLALRPDVLPPQFFDFLGRQARDPEDEQAFSSLKRDIAETVLAAQANDLFLCS